MTKEDAVKAIIEELEDWDRRFDSAETIAECIYEQLNPRAENTMGWMGEGDDKIYMPEYRVAERDGGFEPQMQYQVNHVERWYALLPSGIMADPDVWKTGSTGESYVRVILPTHDMAERAILRARTLNGQNQIAAVSRS